MHIYIATEAEALKEQSVASVAEFVSRLMRWNGALLQQGYNLQEMTKSLKMWKYLLDALQFHKWSKFLAITIFSIFQENFIAAMIFPSNQTYHKNTWKNVIFKVTQSKLLFPQMGRLSNCFSNWWKVQLSICCLQQLFTREELWKRTEE